MSAINQISIYKPDGTLAITTTIADSSQRVRKIMAENYIQIDFVSPTYVSIPVGSTIGYEGFRFVKTRRQLPTYNGAWQYSEQFDDADGFLRTRRTKYYGQDFQELSFALTATLADFAALIVRDVNKEREDASFRQQWTVGTIDAALANSLKTISFSGDTLFDACTAIAQEFETEWYITKYYVPTGSGYEVIQLNFCKKEDGTEINFEIGSGKILNAMNPQRGDDSEYGTRFFVFGGTRNLTEDYKGVPAGSSVPNLYENRLHLPDNQAYIDARNGQIVDDLEDSEVLEQYVTFDDVFPKNRDTITRVDSQIVTDSDNNEYRQYTIQADDCPFAGKGDIIDTLGIKFETGELAGQEFEARLETEDLPWNKRLIIVAKDLGTDGQHLFVPNEQIKPTVGNVFVLTGVKLPSSKTSDAEDELLETGEEYAKKHSADTDVYECISNQVYCYDNPATQGYDIGTRVKLVNTSIFGSGGRSSRIQGVTFSLTKPYEITWEVGDNTKYSRFGEVSTSIEEVKYSQRLGIIDNSLLKLIKSTDYQSPSDENIYTALAAYNHIYKRHDHKGRLIRPDVFCIPLASPLAKGFSLDDGEAAFWLDENGNSASVPSGGSVANVYPLTITKNNVSWLVYNPGTQAETVNFDIPTKVSQLQNDSGYLTQHQSLSNYYTKTEADGKFLTSHQSLADYATKQWVEDKGYLTSHQSLSGYATESWVQQQGYLTSHQSLSGYATESWVNTQIDSLNLDSILSGIASNSARISTLEDRVKIDMPYRLSDLQNDLSLDDLPDGSTRKLANYVPITRKVNGKALDTDITLSLDDVADGNTRKLANYVQKSGDTMTGTLTGPLFVGAVDAYSKYFSVPQAAPEDPETGKIYFWLDENGNSASAPSGGSVANVYPLTITKNNVSWLVYNPGTQAETVNFDIPTKVSQLQNDSGYLTQHQSLSNYYTKTEADGKFLTSHQSLADYATKQWVEDKGYLTSHQSLSGYATESWVQQQGYLTSHQSLSGYATESWVNTQIDSLNLDSILSGIASNSARISTLEDRVKIDMPYRLSDLQNDLSLDDLPDGSTRKLANYVPITRKVNGKALDTDITLSLDDVADGNTRKLANYVQKSGDTMTGTLTGPLFVGAVDAYSKYFSVPQAAPEDPEAGKVYFWIDLTGNSVNS
ncbi:MAG: hypothetical protein E7108_01940 [Bacteroidales bacterium]|nr:hypothetical protein [Bacteroidales bacterium]